MSISKFSNISTPYFHQVHREADINNDSRVGLNELSNLAHHYRTTAPDNSFAERQQKQQALTMLRNHFDVFAVNRGYHLSPGNSTYYGNQPYQPKPGEANYIRPKEIDAVAARDGNHNTIRHYDVTGRRPMNNYRPRSMYQPMPPAHDGTRMPMWQPNMPYRQLFLNVLKTLLGRLMPQY